MRETKVVVVGTRATSVQILQEWARAVMMGSLTVFQRTSQFGVSDAGEEGYKEGG